MKDKEKGLLYHTMHSRPMPGCLPLFFLLALGVAALCIWIAPVKMPERVRPKGTGQVFVKTDRLTHFLLRRQSPRPLHLPNSADPEYHEDAAAAAMPLLRSAQALQREVSQSQPESPQLQPPPQRGSQREER